MDKDEVISGLVVALTALQRVAMKVDDATWRDACERAEVERPCDAAMRALDMASGAEIVRDPEVNVYLQTALDLAQRKALTIPALHLNGSGIENLTKFLEEAIERLVPAFEAIQQTAPHMRDFYVLENGQSAYKQALKEHHARLRKVESVTEDLRFIRLALLSDNADRIGYKLV